MTHEFKHIVQQAKINQEKGLKNVLATVVFLDGSSYRKPGVRMLIAENGKMTGAISGGCVEKEVCRRAQSIFNDEKAKVITYDGRYRLGCEGILYILLESFTVSNDFLNAFTSQLEVRNSFEIQSFYEQNDEVYGKFGSVIRFEDNSSFTFSNNFNPQDFQNLHIFSQQLQPPFKLIIIGAEHDAVKLCTMASLLGWEIDVICSLKDPKQLTDFPGAKSMTPNNPETFNTSTLNQHTALVVMNHSYVLDLKYVLRLQNIALGYIGVLGAPNRRDRMFSEIFELAPNVSEEFLDDLHMPAGLHLGAETPEEIALSILSEILAVTRKKEPISLKNSVGKINA
ncbi:xanthine/CO dehydrogenase XdhC/CoxF family maturation factor [Tenacibaculum adriaticum]|uniref:Xanthine/CO dehydrogenase XdhC/CoxF family maturation factor n=1 Tax=Tenacibaculum adriaticum TaxID=413713 RepID=A0A5S5DVY8_9FLAO|nr:XdhC/CoxI family protein [Tenacibaculum adriaticum]TYQ00151.1 xanthine/CO dehydrogenase XdhC/CoxF family maturation factor [Tenacibaculum adriaticum]